MSAEQVAADLRAAAEVLRRDGWTRDVMYDPSTHCRCLVGAVNYVAGHRDRRSTPALKAVKEHLGIPTIGALMIWNDKREGPDEVIAALEATAEAVQ